MATTTMQLIQKQTVGSAGASSITFSNIPQTFTDLKVVYSVKSTTANQMTDGLAFKFNGSTANLTRRSLFGANVGVGSSTGTNAYVGFAPGTSATNTFGNGELYIPNYTSSNNKSASADNVNEANQSTAYGFFTAILWSQSAAITQIDIYFIGGDSFGQYSSVSLYGISSSQTQNTLTPKASGGDIIVNDGTYWYHAFINSGTFTPKFNFSADVLCVAGGGGGGCDIGGGAGAGGLLGFISQSLTSGTTYTCTVGAGGTGAQTSGRGAVGSDSQFGVLTLVKGGGGGGGNTASAGGNGGSGGGVGYAGNPNTAGTGTSGQGNNGGLWGSTTRDTSGGGGGAGAVGNNGDGTSGQGAAGGVGVSTYSSWGSVTGLGQNISGTYWFAGGGTGGNSLAGAASIAGANGGGGYGGAFSGSTGGAGGAGLANAGGGGGGGTAIGGKGGNGGSGVVIIRYTMA